MARKFKRLKIKKLQINLTNRWLYTLIAFFSLIVIGVFVYAVVPNPGHSISQIEQPSGCSSGQFLKWTGSAWACANVTAGGGSLWSQSGSDIYYNAGNVGIGTTSPLDKLHVNGKLRVATNTQIWDNEINRLDNSSLYLQHSYLGNVIMATGGGNVGIGKTNPEYKLDVNGVIKADIFSGDGSGLSNIKVIVTPSYDVCTSDNDGLLRYRSNYCVGVGERSSSFSICMRIWDTTYSWYLIKSYTWTDASCESPDCPPGEIYYECTGDYADPGCYPSRPPLCFRSFREIQ